MENACAILPASTPDSCECESVTREFVDELQRRTTSTTVNIESKQIRTLFFHSAVVKCTHTQFD
ncbi:AAEL005674-PA [Aedes aegypti]|uniref:AAEL005674-PA n=1 Tax=Aedes aegypti TaxID=7159 RepID=Q179D6_AEDAE|nr:AAEL005674-PA [Aedes aegypti]